MTSQLFTDKSNFVDRGRLLRNIVSINEVIRRADETLKVVKNEINQKIAYQFQNPNKSNPISLA